MADPPPSFSDILPMSEDLERLIDSRVKREAHNDSDSSENFDWETWANDDGDLDDDGLDDDEEEDDENSAKKTDVDPKSLPETRAPLGERQILATSESAQTSQKERKPPTATRRRGARRSSNNFLADDEDGALASTIAAITEKRPDGTPYPKPSYSYSCLIGLALNNSRSGQLTVADIYSFMCLNFPYFRSAPPAWKNSVRHNLSLNKSFQKIELIIPDNQGRKSCLWMLNPEKRGKMANDIRKWRDKDVAGIRAALLKPEELESIEKGTKGVPERGTSQKYYTAAVSAAFAAASASLSSSTASTSNSSVQNAPAATGEEIEVELAARRASFYTGQMPPPRRHLSAANFQNFGTNNAILSANGNNSPSKSTATASHIVVRLGPSSSTNQGEKRTSGNFVPDQNQNLLPEDDRRNSAEFHLHGVAPEKSPTILSDLHRKNISEDHHHHHHEMSSGSPRRQHMLQSTASAPNLLVQMSPMIQWTNPYSAACASLKNNELLARSINRSPYKRLFPSPPKDATIDAAMINNENKENAINSRRSMS